MAAQLLAILGRPVGDLVSAAPGELPTVGLDGIPLHGIFRRDAAKLVLVPDDALLGIVISNGQCSADVLLPFGDGSGVEAIGLADIDA